METFDDGGDNVGIYKWYSSASRPVGTDVNWLVVKAIQYLGNLNHFERE